MKNQSNNPTFFLALLVISSILVTFILLETILRAGDYNPFGNLLNGRESILGASNNIVRVYEATPNSEGFAWGTQVKVNSYGMRDREYRVIKNVKTYRIITLGDSVAFGNGIPVEYTFSNQLEAQLQGSNKEVEVLNLSLGGYNTLQEIATLEDVGLQFQPDLVVIGYVINDIGVASVNLQYVERVQRYNSLIYKSRLAQFIRFKLDAIYIRIYNEIANEELNFARNNKDFIIDVTDDQKLNTLTASLQRELDANGENYSLHAPWYVSQSRIGSLRYSLERLKSLQASHGFDTVMVIIPYLSENDSNESIYELIYEIVSYESERSGVDVINIHDLFKAEGFDNLLIGPKDYIHPNHLGHSLIATTLYNYVNSRQLKE